ncbi:MAG: hypothetical protein HY689_02985 [Chloroflexi bacterium]|nr:hypothetical protein [Chloroflexota bacterium]
MTARSGMAVLIDQVRTLTQASTAEYTLGTASFWDDDHVQELLDGHRVDVYRELLTPIPKHVGGGSIQWLEYRSQFRNLEQTDGGTAVFIVEDSTGADSGTANWTADYQRGIVTFTADQRGTSYFLTGRAYDLYGAAADLLTAWAAREKLQFDFSTDGQRFHRSQKVKMLMQMAVEYRRQQWPRTAAMVRSDIRE